MDKQDEKIIEAQEDSKTSLQIKKNENIAECRLGKNDNKVKIIVGGAICAICTVLALCYFKIYDGGFPISQVLDTYELGSEQNLLDSLKYDESKIINVSIIDRDGFDTNKAGDYYVTYDVINRRKNHETVAYTYHVIDTIAPELVIDKKEIYCAKGGNFDINDYASAMDKSNIYKIKYDEVFDINTPGTYDLNIYAEDESGNKSMIQPVKVIVEDRDNCDVNLANFGDSKEQVKRYETHEFIDENTDDLMYLIEEHGLDGSLI